MTFVITGRRIAGPPSALASFTLVSAPLIAGFGVGMVLAGRPGTSAFSRLADEHAIDLVIEASKRAEQTFANGNRPHHHCTGKERA